MKQPVEDEVALRRYLLGDLPPEEQMQIEERLFLENDYFQQLQGTQEDLLDDYLAGDLSEGEEERFRKLFLSKPEQHEALRFALALQKYIRTNADHIPPVPEIDVRPSPPSKIPFLHLLRFNLPALKFSLVAVLVLLTLGSLWLVIKFTGKSGSDSPGQAQQRKQPEEEKNNQAQGNVQQETNADLNTNVQVKPPEYAEQRNEPRTVPGNEMDLTTSRDRNKKAPKPNTSIRKPPVVYSVLLFPGGTFREGGGANPLTIPLNVDIVQLQLPLIEGADYRSYQATLQNINNTTLLTQSGLKATSKHSRAMVYVKVPNRLLRPQTYRIVLHGNTPSGVVEEVSAYTFQVAKK